MPHSKAQSPLGQAVTPLRIANCSGFYGDKLAAAKEMVEGGPIDVLTGDYLAELTMAILQHKRQHNSSPGYVGTFLKQLREVLALCLQRKIKIVSNAGGLNPQAMASEIETLLTELGLNAQVAYITGDDLAPRLNDLLAAGESLSHLETGEGFTENQASPLSANAYLGGWGIKQALDLGADIVICPRVTDAALVIGPAAWYYNWQRDNYNALAGALVAGHLIECGPSVTGGNYAFFAEVPSFHNIGYPIAEIEANGDCMITKHPGTGGLVSVGTVTAQLLYETNAPAYLNPDVVAHFDSLSLEQVGPDRVAVRQCRGSSPPKQHKVCINIAGGYRNGVELLLTGLDIEEKAKVFSEVWFQSIGGREQFDAVHEQLIRTDQPNPEHNDAAQAVLRLIVESSDAKQVGRSINQKVTELGLGSFPGFMGRAPQVPLGPMVKHWPSLVDSRYITEQVHFNGAVHEVLPTSQLTEYPAVRAKVKRPVIAPLPTLPTAPQAFGRLFGTRSGDKGGCANLGVWAKTDESYCLLYHFLTVEKLQQLLPDMAQYPIDRYELPNVRALNFFIHGVLGDGVAASLRTDGQAKSLGEYLRAKVIELPVLSNSQSTAPFSTTEERHSS